MSVDTTREAMTRALQAALPEDAEQASLAFRVWRPEAGGPSIAVLAEGELIDVSDRFPTMRDLCETPQPQAALSELRRTSPRAGQVIGRIEEVLANSDAANLDTSRPYLLSPFDLQAIKAAGVTIVASLIERMIKERCAGDPDKASEMRAMIEEAFGTSLQDVVPGSPKALAVKEELKRRGFWSQYLEVGIGADAEIFTKAQVLSSVGTGADAGLHPMSEWNNPEPEIVLAIASSGAIVGAALGNDVNLRDVEGRSALLLGRAKDNNASCAIGPCLRFFDDRFDLNAVRRAQVTLRVDGVDGFVLEAGGSMSQMSRDPEALAGQLLGPYHQYPDGAALFLGTTFVPTADRGTPGRGFTHQPGDVVAVASPDLGVLANRMRACNECPPWGFGIRAFMANLTERGLLARPGTADESAA